MKKYDAIIIGFGKGGKTLAADLGSRGWTVAVVERSKEMYGGTCINIGCIPTKTLMHLSKVAQYSHFTTFEQYADAFHKAIEEKRKITAALRQKNFENLDSKETVTVYTGVASFLSPTEVEVKTDRETIVLQAGKIFINTGASTIVPNIKGIEGNPFVYTSTSIMELDRLPRRLAIVGGGYIGLEFASIFANFGSDVTVLEGGDKFISREDRDIADAVKTVLEKKGISNPPECRCAGDRARCRQSYRRLPGCSDRRYGTDRCRCDPAGYRTPPEHRRAELASCRREINGAWGNRGGRPLAYECG